MNGSSSQPSSSTRTPTVDQAAIESGLRAALPAHLHTHASSLARLVADAANGRMSPSEVRNRLDAEPAIAALIQTLAGTTIGDDAAAVSFGAGNNIGTVTMGDVAGRGIIKVDLNIVIGLTYSGIVSPMPSKQRAAVTRMVEDYEAVFGGRIAELADLDAFLEQSEQSCALLLAPTGRGKSALLIHWLARVQAAGGWTAVFAPISRRYETATAKATLGTLAHTLAAFHAEAERLQAYNTSPDQLRPLIADYLRREPSGGRLLLVLDGLDEAVGWQVSRDLFPRTMGPHLRVVASARQVANKTRDDWLEELGWQPERTFAVPLLDLTRKDVADILRRMGDPLDALATDVDLLGEITRVSEGDPLTVRMLVEALQNRRLSPGRLTRMPPGLEPIVRPWSRT